MMITSAMSGQYWLPIRCTRGANLWPIIPHAGSESLQPARHETELLPNGVTPTTPRRYHSSPDRRTRHRVPLSATTERVCRMTACGLPAAAHIGIYAHAWSGTGPGGGPIAAPAAFGFLRPGYSARTDIRHRQAGGSRRGAAVGRRGAPLPAVGGCWL